MKIVVIGGSGLIGSKLVTRLEKLDHEVVAASPATGINSITGEGIGEAFRNTDVVVDVSNSPSFEDKAVMEFFQKSTINLLAASSYAGVKHYVALSIVGTDRLPKSGYLRAKLAQEELITTSGVPYSILRSTQFFEFARQIALAATIDNEVHVTTGAIQPIASDETVAALADVVTNPPLNAITEVGGPVSMPMAEFIRYYLTATQDPRKLIPDEHALYFGTEINDELVTHESSRLGKIKYQDWLSTQIGKA